jgi:hypothetical protein
MQLSRTQRGALLAVAAALLAVGLAPWPSASPDQGGAAPAAAAGGGAKCPAGFSSASHGAGLPAGHPPVPGARAAPPPPPAALFFDAAQPLEAPTGACRCSVLQPPPLQSLSASRGARRG